MTYKNIAGLDLSLTGTAFCALDLYPETTDEDSLLEYVTTIVTKDMRGLERMLFIEDTLKTYLERYAIDLVFLEGFSFGSRGRAVFDTGGLGWIIRRLLGSELKIAFYEIPPTTLKLFVTGKGNSGKPVMLEKTYRRWKIGSEILKDDNMVDAFGLCKLGESFLQWQDKGDEGFTKKELQVFNGIRGKIELEGA